MLRPLSLLLLVACGGPRPTDTTEAFDRLVERSVGKGGVRHAVLRVDAPLLGIEGTWAHGEAHAGEPMTVETPFLAASIGKLFTATTVVLLAKDGLLDLDDPITDWVPAGELAGLPFAGSPSEVRVADLLAHTSGLPDFFVGETTDGTPTVFEQWQDRPESPWSRDDLFAHVREHQEPAGSPGTFTYSDTGYELAGRVIESASGQASFQTVVHDRILAPLALSQTVYHHDLDGHPAPTDWAEAWSGDVEIGQAACLSGDLAGGGLVTTTADLTVFLRALADGTLGVRFDDLAVDTTPDALGRGLDVGRALWTVHPGRVSFLLGGTPELLGASGSTGAFAYYVPGWDAVITGTFDQTDWEEKHLRFLLTRVVPRLGRHAPE